MMKTKILMSLIGFLFGVGLINGQTDEDKLFPSDYVWHYFQQTGGITRIKEKCDFRMQFIGKETVNGKEFHLFQTVGGFLVSEDIVDKTTTIINLDPTLMKPFYIYGEDKKVFVHTRLGAMINFLPSEWTNELALVYDFNVKEGDVLYPATTQGNEGERGTITRVGEIDTSIGKLFGYNIDLEGLLEEYKETTPYNTIEGIGNVFGCFPFYDTLHWTGGNGWGMSVPPTRTGDIYLVKVTDKRGNLIYETEFGKMYAGINEVSSDTSTEEDGILYDLMGFPVTNPQPGSIYIRNGKKFVMK